MRTLLSCQSCTAEESVATISPGNFEDRAAVFVDPRAFTHVAERVQRKRLAELLAVGDTRDQARHRHRVTAEIEDRRRPRARC